MDIASSSWTQNWSAQIDQLSGILYFHKFELYYSYEVCCPYLSVNFRWVWRCFWCWFGCIPIIVEVHGDATKDMGGKFWQVLGCLRLMLLWIWRRRISLMVWADITEDVSKEVLDDTSRGVEKEDPIYNGVCGIWICGTVWVCHCEVCKLERRC